MINILIILSDSKLQGLESRLSIQKSSGGLGLVQHWNVRIGLVEWTRDMYDEYRLRKWSEIQDLISEIFLRFDAEEVMTVLLMAEVTARSIGIFMENEEEEDSSDDSQVGEEEMMLVEGQDSHGNYGGVNTMQEEEDMEEGHQISGVPAVWYILVLHCDIS